MKSHNFDELLIKALAKSKELEFSSVPSEDEIEHSFSEKYIRARNKIFSQLGRSYWKYINTMAKKAAVVIISLILAFSALMTVDAFRESVVNFGYMVYRTFTEFEQKKENTKTHISTFYTIENVPAEYTLGLCNFGESGCDTAWFDENNQLISLSQLLTFSSHTFNSENSELKEEIINGTACLTCKNEMDYFCFWEFDGYRFALIYPVSLGEEFMADVVGKLKEADTDSSIK